MPTPTSVPGLRNNWTIGRLLTWGALLFMLFITLMPMWMVAKTALTHPHDLFTHST